MARPHAAWPSAGSVRQKVTWSSAIARTSRFPPCARAISRVRARQRLPPPPNGGRQGHGFTRAQRRHHGPPPITAQVEKLRELGVSDDQIKTLKELEYKMGIERVDLKAGVEKAELSLRQQMQSDAPDQEAVLQLVDQLNTARGAMFKSHIVMQLKVREVVGADVIEKLRPERR